MKILVGVDGAEGGVDALALARELAPADAELLAVLVAVTDAHPSRAVNLDFDRYVREDALVHLGELRTEHPDLRGEVLEASSVAAGLQLAAERHEADLLVVGSCRRGVVGRLFAGDDARQTLRHAPCPVAIAPRGHALRSGPVVRVGAGWDGGEEGEQALAFARTLADGLGGDVHVLGVVPCRPLDGPVGPNEVRAAVDELRDELALLPGVTTASAAGDPADELARFGGEVDVLVVGSHGRGPLGRVAIGSVSEALARRCSRPLVVVPRVRAPASVG
ncbi:MAG: universal stress protein [Solirubrobacterales bacterium]|jgi:nucleotide-binding universal stress UspA family protein|nr:universal stress protein [Solirubrobacterales bacterium]